MEKWYRMLTGTSENMKDLSRMEEEKAKLYNEMPAPRKKRLSKAEEANVNAKKTGQGGSWMQVHIPYPETNTFVRRPKTSADVEIKAHAIHPSSFPVPC